MMLKLYVCTKHVPDTAAAIRVVDNDDIDPDVLFAMNPYDEYALEEALRLRDRLDGDTEIVLVTVGPEAAGNTLRAGLAMGANRAIHVQRGSSWTDGQLTARTLARAIEQDGAPYLIFTGMKAVDHEGMQIPYRLAAHFDLPVISQVAELQGRGDTITVYREGEAGMREVYELPPPCVIGTAKGVNEPRLPKLPDIMKARRKEVKHLTEEDLALDPTPHATRLVKLTLPPEKPPARILDGPVDAAAQELVSRLAEDLELW